MIQAKRVFVVERTGDRGAARPEVDEKIDLVDGLPITQRDRPFGLVFGQPDGQEELLHPTPAGYSLVFLDRPSGDVFSRDTIRNANTLVVQGSMGSQARAICSLHPFSELQ